MSSPATSTPTTAELILLLATWPNTVTARRDSKTTSTSCKTTTGTATSAGSTPSRAPKTTRLMNASRVTAVAIPAKAAPSKPTASRRGGTGVSAKCSARSIGAPPHTGPTIRPASHNA